MTRLFQLFEFFFLSSPMGYDTLIASANILFHVKQSLFSLAGVVSIRSHSSVDLSDNLSSVPLMLRSRSAIIVAISQNITSLRTPKYTSYFTPCILHIEDHRSGKDRSTENEESLAAAPNRDTFYRANSNVFAAR